MKRSIWVYGGLLAVLLVLSYLRWVGVLGSEEQKEEVVVLRGEASEIERVRYHDEKLDVDLQVKEDALGRYAWVQVDERKEKPKPKEGEKAKGEKAGDEKAGDEKAGDEKAGDDKAGDEKAGDDKAGDEKAGDEKAEAQAGNDEAKNDKAKNDEAKNDKAKNDEAKNDEAKNDEAEVEVKTTVFKGGKSVDDLLDQLSPLKAIRALEVTPDKLESLGLKEPEAWLEVTRKGRTRRLELGGESYGTHDRYVHDLETGKYYLVDADVLRPLKYARTRLPDRRLSPYKEGDLLRVVLEANGKSAEMLHQNREDEDKAYWANPQDTGRKMEIYENWLDKALRLRALSYVQPGEQPEGLRSEFTLTLVPEKDPQVKVEVLSAPDPDAKGDAAEDRLWFARSDFTRGLVRLHKVLASEAAADVEDVIEAKPEEEPEEEDAGEGGPQGEESAGTSSEEPAQTAEPQAPVKLPPGSPPPPKHLPLPLKKEGGD